MVRAVAMLLVPCAVAGGCRPAEPSRGDGPLEGLALREGIEFRYWSEGQGHPCFVVGDAHTVARALSPQLKERIRFIFLASRMTTPEDRVGDVSRVSMETLVEDIEQVRQQLNLGHVCVLGHSISGLLALEYGRRHPEVVSHVVMHGTPPLYNERFASALDAFWQEVATEDRRTLLERRRSAVGQDSLAKLSSSDAAIQGYIVDAPRYFYDASYDPAWLLEGAYWNTAAWGHLFEAILSTYDIGHGEPLRVPVFLALGRHDFAVPYTSWDSERAKIPDLQLHLFERSGHYPMLEEPELFDRALLAWLDAKR